LPGPGGRGILFAEWGSIAKAGDPDADSHQEGTGFLARSRLLRSRQSWSLDDRA